MQTYTKSSVNFDAGNFARMEKLRGNKQKWRSQFVNEAVAFYLEHIQGRK